MSIHERHGKLTWVAATVSTILFTAISGAQDPANVLKLAAERCGQFEAQVHDMRMTQVMKAVSPEGETTYEQTVYTKGKKSRVEMKMPLPEGSTDSAAAALQTVMVNDGVNAWIISPFGGKKQLSAEEAKQNEPARNCWGFFPDNARVTGTGSAQDRDCYIIELDDEGVHTRLWIDRNSFIPVKGETRVSTGAERYHWTHSDFRAIHGDWDYPFHTDMYDGDQLAATMSVTGVEVNQNLSNDLFDPDKVVVQPLDLDQLMKMMSGPEDENRDK